MKKWLLAIGIILTLGIIINQVSCGSGIEGEYVGSNPSDSFTISKDNTFYIKGLTKDMFGKDTLLEVRGTWTAEKDTLSLKIQQVKGAPFVASAILRLKIEGKTLRDTYGNVWKKK